MQRDTDIKSELLGSLKLLERAARSCEIDWIPISARNLQLIQRKIAAGVYNTDKHALLDDLKRDLGLYTYCLRSLRRIEQEHGVGTAGGTPAERLLRLDEQSLKKLLLVEPRKISSHGLEGMGRSQAQSLKFTVTSSATAELFAEETGVDAELTYISATLRQLGSILIAFNYPGVYKRAVVESADTGKSLNQVLESHLGFTPQELGLKIIEAWELGEEIVCALKESMDSERTLNVSSGRQPEEHSLVRRYCEIGEALARVNDPRTYPAAVEEWHDVITQINSTLGINGISLINQRVQERAQSYCEALPDVFAQQVDPTKSLEVAHHTYWTSLIAQNLPLKQCSEEIQAQFRHAYQHLKPGKLSPIALNMLATTVFPSIGFARGCIFVLNRETGYLIPKLRIGLAAHDRYGQVASTASGPLGEAIGAALDCTSPVIQDDVELHNDTVSHISWRLDENRHTSVLHLEYENSLKKISRKDLLSLFHSARIALLHCLNFAAE